jgi:hypothetical protein
MSTFDAGSVTMFAQVGTISPTLFSTIVARWIVIRLSSGPAFIGYALVPRTNRS